MGPPQLDLVPADVGQPGRLGDQLDPTGQEAEQLGVVLGQFVEEQLETEADAQVPGAARDRGPNRIVQPVAVEAAHRRTAGPDPGHDQARHLQEPRVSPSIDHDGACPDRPERLDDASQVAGPVVDHGDLGPWRDPPGGLRSTLAGHPRRPLVEGTPARRGSSSTAARRATARALKAASAT